MLCNDPDACSNCDEPRTIPWANDIPIATYDEFDMSNFEDLDEDGTSEDEAGTACQNAGHTWNGYEDECFDPYAAGIMNAALRDFIVLDRSGNGAGECRGNYDAIKALLIEVINN